MIRILLSIALVGAAIGGAVFGIFGLPGRISHQPPAAPSIASKLTVYPSDFAKATSGAIRCRWESPVRGSDGGCSGVGSTPGSGSVWESSNTNAVLKKTHRSPVSSPWPSRRLTVTGARTRSAVSPFRTQRPSFSQALNPATRSGTIPRSWHCSAISMQFPAEYA